MPTSRCLSLDGWSTTAGTLSLRLRDAAARTANRLAVGPWRTGVICDHGVAGRDRIAPDVLCAQIDEEYRGTSALGAARSAALGAADGVVPLILAGLVPAVTVRAAPVHGLFGPQETGGYHRVAVGSVTRARRLSAKNKRNARQPAVGAVG
jgi:hypothetical protein